MAIRLIAATMTDGNGIVADKHGEVYLVKPPFDFYGKEHLPYDLIESTIQQFGFTELNEDYTTWAEVFERLRAIAWEARKSVGDTSKTVTEEDRKAFFRSIPEGFLVGAVERLEAYAQNKEVNRALFTGKALLENPNLVKLPELYQRVAAVVQNESRMTSVFRNVNWGKLNKKKQFVPSFALVEA
ncbi:MAG TPA: hypothetical protein DCR35_01040 [Runella sp.]|nr:hypothetical protein [Runella sp.]HAO47996.1 hypothetical protein [Runella sp.]